MRAAIILAVSLSVAAPLSASAQPSSKPATFARSKPPTVRGVETIKPQETPSKDEGAKGWNGSYVGVNAGTGFGATAGTNVVVPFGADGNGEK